jgi:hypothetical protein
MKAFKVVRPEKSRYVSAVVSKIDGVTIQYIPGQWVGPRIDNSKIFVFDNFTNAELWARAQLSNYEIWECEVDILESPIYSILPGWGIRHASEVGYYWQKRFGLPAHETINIGIEGAKMCNFIKLLHKV